MNTTAIITVRIVSDFAHDIRELQTVVTDPQSLRTTIMQRVRHQLNLRVNPVKLLKELKTHVASEHTRLLKSGLRAVETRIREIMQLKNEVVHARRNHVREHHDAALKKLQFHVRAQPISESEYDKLKFCLAYDLAVERSGSMPKFIRAFADNQEHVFAQGFDNFLVCDNDFNKNHSEWCDHLDRDDARNWIMESWQKWIPVLVAELKQLRPYVSLQAWWERKNPSIEDLVEHADMKNLDHEDRDLALMNVTIHNFEHYLQHLSGIQVAMDKALKNLGSIEELIDGRIKQITDRMRMTALYRKSVELLDGMLDETQDMLTIETEMNDLGQGLGTLVKEIDMLSEGMTNSAMLLAGQT